ncbi:CUB and zona pellucida-like domain-containing protein 1 isoform X1 [Haliotis cracherodii]|uniref:CUB and zona pellucida-like domain-containing protein 1 isoform X1 n=1 Tax=Haliotis cracherodii TaxID=6455 RepID=UPI0039EAA316
MQPIMASFSANQGPTEVFFTKDLYIRFKAHKGAKFQFKWETYTDGHEELEKAVAIQCSPDAIKASVDLPKLKAVFVSTDPSHLSLGDVTCTGVTQGNTWSATARHGSCNTQRQVDDDFVVYKTSVVYSLPGTSPGDFIILWSAKTNYSIISENNIVGLNTTSHYSAIMRIFSDRGLHNEVKGQPIRVKLGSELYAEVEFSANFKASMRLQRCSLKDRLTQANGYDLIRNGCPVDRDTNVIAETSSATVFHFKATEFVAGVTSVYLTCDVTYCLPNDNSQVCIHQCSTTPHGRRQVSGYSLSVARVAKKFDIFT